MSDRVSLESSGGMYTKRRTASTFLASPWGPWIWPWRFFSEAAPHSQARRWMDVKFVWPQLQLLLFIVEPKAKASTIKQQHPHMSYLRPRGCHPGKICMTFFFMEAWQNSAWKSVIFQQPVLIPVQPGRTIPLPLPPLYPVVHCMELHTFQRWFGVQLMIFTLWGTSLPIQWTGNSKDVKQKNNWLPFFHKQNFNCNFWLLSPSFLVVKNPSPSLPVATVDPSRQSSKWWANWKRRSCFFFAQETSRRCTRPGIKKTETSWGHLAQQHLRTLILLKSTDLTSIS